MTRLVSDVRGLIHGIGQAGKPYQWFIHEHGGLTAGVVSIVTSQSIAEGTLFYGVLVYVRPRDRVLNCHVRINICLVQNENPTVAEIVVAEAVIPFSRGNQPSYMEIAGEGRDIFIPCAKRIEGSNKRICVAFRGTAAGVDIAHCGVMYQEP